MGRPGYAGFGFGAGDSARVATTSGDTISADRARRPPAIAGHHHPQTLVGAADRWHDLPAVSDRLFVRSLPPGRTAFPPESDADQPDLSRLSARRRCLAYCWQYLGPCGTAANYPGVASDHVCRA